MYGQASLGHAAITFLRKGYKIGVQRQEARGRSDTTATAGTHGIEKAVHHRIIGDGGGTSLE